ncbi:MarR family winged helix-turn-helix transcriptional regulator [Actinoplanes sp. L3-i22]|uniref:MarR family winged helix-turn-helix transcriptional regulator n=1 Tax=Actinoplanes sp. L3-i22 TaxID=2836373 RepID=UPI001C74CA9F|nr:MarR family transcriptional regulator [Actinoplanes sp. L3-i22]BCY08162.1 transcriptional regulator [Actinoplanes sp. L3-i22]
MTDDYAALEREFAVFVRRARAASQRLSHGVHPGLDASAYGLLVRLRDQGPRRPSDVAEDLGVGKATITRQLKPLEALGLIERLPDPADGRAHLVALTEEGRRRMLQARAARSQRLRARLGAWPREDVHTLATLLARFNTITMD